MSSDIVHNIARERMVLLISFLLSFLDFLQTSVPAMLSLALSDLRPLDYSSKGRKDKEMHML